MPITPKMHYWQYSDTLNEKRGTTKFKAKYQDTFWNTDIRPNSDIVSICRLNNKQPFTLKNFFKASLCWHWTVSETNYFLVTKIAVLAMLDSAGFKNNTTKTAPICILSNAYKSTGINNHEFHVSVSQRDCITTIKHHHIICTQTIPVDLNRDLGIVSKS